MIIPCDDKVGHSAVIKVVGVGGGGGNAINTMIESGFNSVEFIAANTDLQALNRNLAPVKIQLGEKLTKGLGAGAKPEVGRESAIEAHDQIKEYLTGADMVFVTCGMGGGTGTGAAPIIAEIAKELGALTVGVVTKPFKIEGAVRKRNAETGISNLKECVDALITVPNDKILELTTVKTSGRSAYKMSDEVLLNSVQGISDLIHTEGFINVDFADVKTVMENQGLVLMSMGIASGDGRAEEAIRMAVNSPLLEDVSLDGAMSVLAMIYGSEEITMSEICAVGEFIHEAADPEANIIYGTAIDPSLGDQLKVTLVATGFEYSQANMHDDYLKSSNSYNVSEEKVTIPLTVNKTSDQLVTPVSTPKAPVQGNIFEDMDVPAYLRRGIKNNR